MTIENRCPTCGAAAGEACLVKIQGETMIGWTHDARILYPIVHDLRGDMDTCAVPQCDGRTAAIWESGPGVGSPICIDHATEIARRLDNQDRRTNV